MSVHPSVRLSACLPISTGVQVNGFLQILILMRFIKMCREIQILFKSAKNIRHFTWAPKYILLFLPILNSKKTLSSIKMVSGCQGSRGRKSIMPERHSVMLYVHYPSCKCISFFLVPSKSFVFPWYQCWLGQVETVPFKLIWKQNTGKDWDSRPPNSPY